MMINEMTIFQKNCLAHCQTLLGEKFKRHLNFELVGGKTERYLVGSIDNKGMRFEIYIYEDEAGFFKGKEWFICEKQDFDSSDKLIKAFINLLKANLS